MAQVDSQRLLYAHLLPDTYSNTNLCIAERNFANIIKIPNQLTLR